MAATGVLVVTGTWASQYVGSAPDLTGLTVYIQDGSMISETTDYATSPTLWTQAGQQTITFTYTAGGLVDDAVETVTVLEPISNKFVINAELYEYLEAPETGYSVTFPSISGSNTAYLRFDLDDQQGLTASNVGGNTFTNITTIRVYISGGAYYIHTLNINADTTFNYTYYDGATFSNNSTSWVNTIPIWAGGDGIGEFTLTLSNNTTFSTFDLMLLKGVI